MKKSKTIENNIYKKDSRTLNEIIKEKLVDVTITSPPYFDLKDYGHKKQIGFGQKYEDYLNDLKIVFKNVFDCTKDNGTLWVIIDSYRRDSEVIPLPFDFSNKIKDIGWKLQEVVIWAKDRTVPWAHQGQMRNLFEYILLFSKKEKYNFFIDEVRDVEALKKWWVKYPERYNPKGKIPDGLWHFDIPVQGSWGNGYIKHFCPLPEEMISQILKISSKEGDIVLDPFAGSGAVLAKASNMNRNYIGFELNQSYISMFKNYIKKTGAQKRKEYINDKNNLLPRDEFNALIIELRSLKYAKLILKHLPSSLRAQIKKIYVEKLKGDITQRNALCRVSYQLYCTPEVNIDKLAKELEKISDIPPLSKFGIQPEFRISKNLKRFQSCFSQANKIYTYTNTVTHQFKSLVKPDKINDTTKSEVILSKIRVQLNEKDYE